MGSMYDFRSDLLGEGNDLAEAVVAQFVVQDPHGHDEQHQAEQRCHAVEAFLFHAMSSHCPDISRMTAR